MSHEEPLTRAQMQQGIAEELQGIAGNMCRQRPVIDEHSGRSVKLRQPDGSRRKLINWASNDYLGATQLLKQKNAGRRALRSWGSGSGAARLLAGGLALHRRFEQRLAGFLGYDDALLCTTGYQANIAALGALIGDPEDVVILDRLAHASMYDGARLANGSMLRFKHNDLADLEQQLRRTQGARRRLVCIESIYSMDGDQASLLEIDALCSQYGALLYVDEAHALGVFGDHGRGCCAAAGVRPDILLGTASKSLGAQGGFILADTAAIELMVNRGRSFMYSTAPVPAAVEAAIASIDLLQADASLQSRLQARAATVRAAVAEQGWDSVDGVSPIIPLITGGEDETLALSAKLLEAGHYIPAIRPPTVPPHKCRLRVTVTLAHTEADIRRLIRDLAVLRA